MLIGIKIIKLNGWENVFKEKIQNTRQEELKYLIKDSIYWTLMSECITFIRNQLPLKPLFISKIRARSLIIIHKISLSNSMVKTQRS